MKPFRLLFTFFALLFSLSAAGQIRLEGWNASKIDPGFTTGCGRLNGLRPRMSAGTTMYVISARASLERLPEHFLVHISADNRYKLFVNGRLVSLGPALGDVYNWNFETVDLAPYLVPGRNVLAAVVWHFGEKRPLAQMTFGSLGFLLQGNTPAEEGCKYRCVVALPAQCGLCALREPVLGYYAAGACERGRCLPLSVGLGAALLRRLRMGCRRTDPAGCDEGGYGLSGTPARADAHTADGVPADRTPRLRRVAGAAGIGDAGPLTFPIVVAAQTQAGAAA